MTEAEALMQRPFTVGYDPEADEYYIFAPPGCVLVDGHEIEIADADTTNHTVSLDCLDPNDMPDALYAHVTQDASSTGGYKVEFDDEAPFLVTNVGNQKWMLEHGDRYKGSTAAAGAINTVLRTIGNDLRRNHADVAIMGHWHTGAEGAVDAREDGRMTKVYINPSIVGPDDFATTVLHAFYPAESSIFITTGDAVKSKISIDLSDIQE